MAQVEMIVTAEEPDGSKREARLIEESTFATDVRVELDRARGVGSGKLAYPPMASLHEGYAVILEEVDEFWDIVKLKPSLRNYGDLYKELVQISAMAQRTAEDLQLKAKAAVQDGVS